MLHCNDFFFVFLFRQPQSSMVFGTNALITKPALSLAPMITVAFLNTYGYEHMKTSIEDNSMGSLPVGPLAELQGAMFYIICLTPIVIGFLQSFIWSFYTIRNTHTRIVKHVDV